MACALCCYLTKSCSAISRSTQFPQIEVLFSKGATLFAANWSSLTQFLPERRLPPTFLSFTGPGGAS